MNPITDAELLLFHYRDGLDADRHAQIEDELLFDAALRRRLSALRDTLSAVDAHWPPVAADDGLEARVWARLAPQLSPRRVQRRGWTRLVEWLALPAAPRLALAGLVVAALAVGFLLGRQAPPVRDPATPPTALLGDDAASRVLAGYLADHLQQTERALLVASHSPRDGAAAIDLAASLVDANRLYALAAERAGKPALAQFLRELEPVLVELGSAPGAVDADLALQIREHDLPFKTRAAAALARQQLAGSPQSL